MSLTARVLEEGGIPTVIVGSARDVVEHCGVPRFLFTDFPLGNPCGEPWNPEQQREILEQAFDLLESARHPRTTVQSPFRWRGGDDWRASYARVDESRRDQLLAKGQERRLAQRRARGETTSGPDRGPGPS